MAWQELARFNIPKGRNDAITIPAPSITAKYCSIKVSDRLNKPNWTKAGDLYQSFSGDIRSPAFFVKFRILTAFNMHLGLGRYYLKFKPVPWHEGLFCEVWQWFENILNTGFWADSGSWDDDEIFL